MKRNTLIGILALGLFFVAVGLSLTYSSRTTGQESTPETGKPAQWLWAPKLERPGLPNLHKVSDALYRGAQPEPKDVGFVELKKLGVKTIVNLRSLHGESDEVEEAGLKYERIFFNPLRDPQDDEVVRFLKVFSDPSKVPAFVHCKHGADRTGTMCAAYRVVVQNWPKDEAVRELKENDTGFHGQIYESYAQYILNLDVEKMRKAVASAPADK